MLSAIVAGAMALAFMVWQASSAPVVRHLQLHLTGWPVTSPPMRVVLMSDLHVSSPGDSLVRLRSTIATVNALKPDLILLAGDYIATGIFGAYAYAATRAIAPLAQLHARLGSVAVLGNHDYSAERQVRTALSKAGILLLDNSAVRKGPLAIVGISDEFSGHARPAAAISSWRTMGGVALALTHSPDVVPQLPPSIKAILAGHTHCGQVSFPIVGPPITQSRFGQRYACGIVREGDRISVITAGLGTSGEPIRLFAPPDLWVLEIGR